MAAGTWNFTLEQGTTFVQPLVWTNSDGSIITLTGYTAHMQIRDKAPAPGVDTTLYKDLSNAGGQIVITGNTGTITLVLTAAETAALTFKTAIYDLVVISPAGARTRLLQGTVTLAPEVTRD